MNRSNSRIFSFSSIAIAIGVLGGVSSIITVFFTSEDLNAKINSKWLVLALYLALTTILVLSKAIYDLRIVNRSLIRSPSHGFSPIKYIKNDGAFVVSRINELSYDSVVSLHILVRACRVILAPVRSVFDGMRGHPVLRDLPPVSLAYAADVPSGSTPSAGYAVSRSAVPFCALPTLGPTC